MDTTDGDFTDNAESEAQWFIGRKVHDMTIVKESIE